MNGHAACHNSKSQATALRLKEAVQHLKSRVVQLYHINVNNAFNTLSTSMLYYVPIFHPAKC